AAGLAAAGFEKLLQRISGDPEGSLEVLRQLLYDATGALLGCATAGEALAALTRFDGHAFAALLHRHELSNWVLYARAYARPAFDPDEAVRDLDRVLRNEDDALAWLVKEWVEPAMRSTRVRGNVRPAPRARR